MSEILEGNLLEDTTPLSSDDNIRLAVAQANNNYSEIGFLEELFQLFLQAVDKKSPKYGKFETEQQWIMAGKPCWHEGSKFEQFCQEALVECEFRLEELQFKKKQAKDNIPLITTLGSAGSLLIESNQLHNYEPADPAYGKPLDPEIAEIYEFVARRNIETLQKFLRGELKLDNPRLTHDNVVEAMGIESLDENKKDKIVDNVMKIQQKIN